MSKCNICGSEVSPHEAFCPVCGQALMPEKSNVRKEETSNVNLESKPENTEETEETNQPVVIINPLSRQQNQIDSNSKPLKKDAISIGYGIISFIFPLIGLIMFCSWRDIYPKRSKSCLVGFVIGVCISVLAKICFALYMKSMNE